MASAYDVIPASGGYLKLIEAFPLRPIRSDDELKAATAFLEALSRREDLDDDEEDYLSLLADIIKAYERVRFPLKSVSPAESLRNLIEAKGVTQAEVAKATGIGVSAISEILHGKRRVAISHVPKFAAYFAVEPGLFVPSTAEEESEA